MTTNERALLLRLIENLEGTAVCEGLLTRKGLRLQRMAASYRACL